MSTITAPAPPAAGRESQPGETLLEVRNLAVEFLTPRGPARAVDNVSFTIRQGEVFGLAGESGCGKSTVAHAIMRLIKVPGRISGGEVLFRGQDLNSLSIKELQHFRWLKASIVFQSAMNALNPVMNMGDQLADAIIAHERMSKKQALDRAAEMFKLVGIESRRLKSYPHELSGGMRQRSVIAMALALNPELVIMDEPTTALDVVVQRDILQQVQDLQARFGFSILFITHDLSLLVEFSTRIAIMYAGKLVDVAPARELFENPKHPYTVGLMSSFPSISGEKKQLQGIPGTPPDLVTPPPGCRFAPRCPHVMERCTITYPPLREVEQDHLTACYLYEGPAGANMRRASVQAGDVVMEVNGLSKFFAAGSSGGILGVGGEKRFVHAVEDVSFNLRRGQILALVGESGSGKSTIARLLSGLYPVSAGEILFKGSNITRLHGRRQLLGYRSQVQMVFQDPFGSLNPVKTIAHHIERPLIIHHQAAGRLARRAMVHELLRTVGLTPPEEVAAKYPHQLSGGQRQRVSFARALAVKPEVILADEPISMLDVSIRMGILNMMSALRDERGLSYLYITHDLASARYIADETLVLYAGHLVEAAESEEVMVRPLHPYTRLLLSAVPDPLHGLAQKRVEARGEIPTVINPKPGCRFANRCPKVMDICRQKTPQIYEPQPGHRVRCYLYADGATPPN